MATTTYDYNAETSAGSNTYTGAYQGGAVTHTHTYTTWPGDHSNADQRNTYVWWDTAVQSQTDYDSQINEGTVYPWHSYFTYDANGHLSHVEIDDGRPRDLDFIVDSNGLVLQRHEDEENREIGDPMEIHYYFNGMAVGDVSNNGTSDVDYATSIAEHTATYGSGPFRNGALNSANVNYADFDQSYDPINGLNYEATSSRYTVVEGDTLQNIAYTIWGDASFWYMIADANGLDGSETLTAGQDLIIPNKVHNSHNSADTYRVYDPNDAIGNTTPNLAKPPKHQSGGCGVMGQILLVVIAVVVTALTLNPLIGALTTTLGSTGAAIVGGAIAGAAGSIVSQGVGVLTGIQSKFDWGAVAMAAIGGGVSGGLGVAIPGSSLGAEVARGVLGNAITQGIGVATGLQKRFDWAGVAAAGIMAGVSHIVSNALPGAPEYGTTAEGVTVTIRPASGGNQFISGMAGMLAGAATRTLVDGSDFGDNIMAMLPDAVGQTIGNMVAGAVQSDDPLLDEFQKWKDGANYKETSSPATHLSAMVEFLKAHDVPVVDASLDLSLRGAAGTVYSPVAFTDVSQLTPKQLDDYWAARANTRDGQLLDDPAALELVSFEVNAQNLADVISTNFSGAKQGALLRLVTMVRVSEDSYYDHSATALLRGTGYARLSNEQLSSIDRRLPGALTDAHSGYFGAVYSNGTDYILANRGTEITGVSDIELGKDIIPNIAGIKGFASDQGWRALDAASLLSDALGSGVHLEFTGQSLGGYFAQLQTLATGRPSTAINSSPGPDDKALAAYHLSSGYAGRIVNHTVRGETVDFFQHNLAVKALGLGLRTEAAILFGGPLPGWDLVPDYPEGSANLAWAPGPRVGGAWDYTNVLGLNDHYTSGMLSAIGAWVNGGPNPEVR